MHLHCIVSGGGIKNNQWVAPKRSNGKFLFPTAALKKEYKERFLRLINERKHTLNVQEEQLATAIEESGKKVWKVYAKRTFGAPEQVVKYLGRYTHRTAITYHRIRSVDQQTITFEYKDYRDNQSKTMTLSHQEFLERFERHILPRRFVRIRHYGLLANRGKAARLKALREEMDWQAHPPRVEVPVAIRMLEKYGRDITICQECKKGHYQLLITRRFGKVTYHKPRDIPLNA